MIEDVREITGKGKICPGEIFSEIKKLAADEYWKKRQDAATALVEISKKKDDEVIREMIIRAGDNNFNIRRAASEGLRGVARRNPEKNLPVIEKLKTDDAIYVRKSVAALLRAISRKNPEFVLNLCKKWAGLKNKNTDWIIMEGMKKLPLDEREELKFLLNN